MKKSNESHAISAKGEKQEPPGEKRKLLPIIDMTTRDSGTGFVIGLGGNEDEQQVEPKRAPPTSPRTPRKSSGKPKKK